MDEVIKAPDGRVFVVDKTTQLYLAKLALVRVGSNAVERIWHFNGAISVRFGCKISSIESYMVGRVVDEFVNTFSNNN